MEKYQKLRFLQILQRREVYSILGKCHQKRKKKSLQGPNLTPKTWRVGSKRSVLPISKLQSASILNGRGYFAFHFQLNSNQDCHISQWTMIYEPLWPLYQQVVFVFLSERGIPTTITIQVHLPHFSLIFSNPKTLEETPKSIGKCFHRADTNASMYVSSCISVQGLI